MLAAPGAPRKPESTPDRPFSYSRAVQDAVSGVNAGSGLNGDGVVDATDLGILLSQWG
jgi:hypothetical protein